MGLLRDSPLNEAMPEISSATASHIPEEAWAAGRQGARRPPVKMSKRARGEACLYADDDIDRPRWQVRFRQSGTQLLFRDHTETRAVGQ